MITLYDISSKLESKSWSPNTLRTRISLNYKDQPYETEWVEYPDIESTVRRLGGTPTGKKKDGSDYYTLPAMHDSATGKTITDSKAIAEYLDATYPDTPPLFPPGSRAAVAMFQNAARKAFIPIFPITLPATHSILNPRSAEYFRSTRENWFGKKLEEFAPPGPIRDGIWKEVRESWEQVATCYDQNGPVEDKPFFFGDTFSFADAIIIAYFVYFNRVLGAESGEWKEMTSWSNGRWRRLVEMTQDLQAGN